MAPVEGIGLRRFGGIGSRAAATAVRVDAPAFGGVVSVVAPVPGAVALEAHVPGGAVPDGAAVAAIMVAAVSSDGASEASSIGMTVNDP